MPAYRGEHEDVIRPFTDAMRYKLAVSKRKGRTWRDAEIEQLFKLLRHEVDELEEAISLGNTIEIMLEAADIGNYAMFIADLAIRAAAQGANSQDGRRNTRVTPHVDQDFAGPTPPVHELCVCGADVVNGTHPPECPRRADPLRRMTGGDRHD